MRDHVTLGLAGVLAATGDDVAGFGLLVSSGCLD